MPANSLKKQLPTIRELLSRESKNKFSSPENDHRTYLIYKVLKDVE
jgi:hypothetical protein